MIEDSKVLGDSAADAIMAAALAEATKLGLRLSLALVDDSGTLLRFTRMRGVHAGTVDVAIAKARSAALFKRAGSAFGEQLAAGATALTFVPNLMPYDGSEPVGHAGWHLGGLGVSGSSPANDGAVARAGLAALNVEGQPS